MERELNSPLYYSQELLLVMIEIIVIIALILLFYKYFYNVVRNYYKRPGIVRLKDRYIKKLNKLTVNVQENKIELREAYLKLSSIIREFIEKSTSINVLSLSKEEVKKIGIEELSLLMEEYYPPEFSKYSNGDIVKSIERTMLLLEKWN